MFPDNRTFSLSRNKKLNWKPSGGRSQENECCKRLIYKQFVHVSGLCGPQFLSYLPKRFMHLCRALYRDAMLVYHFGPPIWPPEINKNIWSSPFVSQRFLFTRELAYVRINISSNTWNGYTAENQEERLFSTRQHSYFGVTHRENSEVEIGHLHDGVILLLRPESFSFFLSSLNFVIPVRFE